MLLGSVQIDKIGTRKDGYMSVKHVSKLTGYSVQYLRRLLRTTVVSGGRTMFIREKRFFLSCIMFSHATNALSLVCPEESISCEQASYRVDLNSFYHYT